jgi:hypothetical protein
MRMRHIVICGLPRATIFFPYLINGTILEKKKRILSIFNDESTGSFICLRRHVYMYHVNKVQLIRVKMIRIAAIRRASLREAWVFIESLLSPV